MNKTKFIIELAERTGRPISEVHKNVNNFLALATEVLAREENVTFLGFGHFYPRKQQARPVRNPKTGDPFTLDERTTVRFKPGKSLFKTINKK